MLYSRGKNTCAGRREDESVALQGGTNGFGREKRVETIVGAIYDE